MKKIDFLKTGVSVVISLASLFLLDSCLEKKAEDRKNIHNSASQNAEIFDKNKSEIVENLENAEFEKSVEAKTGETPALEEKSKENDTPNDEFAKIRSIDINTARLNPSKFIQNQFEGTSIHDSSNLFVIGFSRSGKIAFIESQFLEGVGMERATFFVQDLVSDDILAVVHSDDADEASYGEAGAVDFFIKKNAEKIDSLLFEHEIIKGEFKIEQFPYFEDGRTLGVTANIFDTGEFMNDFIRLIDYTITAEDGAGRKKTITSKKGEADENVFVCGFVKNPWENRIAVVIAEARFGFEGYDILYSISGCDAQKGF